MDSGKDNELLDQAVEQIKNRPVDTGALERLSDGALQYIREHTGRKRHFLHPVRDIFNYAAVALVFCGVLWYLYLSSVNSPSNLVWGDVVKRVSTIDCIHLYHYDYVGGVLVSSRHGWGWYGGGKICFIDDKGAITVDDGDTKTYYSPAGVPQRQKQSEFGNIDQCVSGGNFVFDMLIKGVFGYNEQQISQVLPSEVGQDFLVYKFDAPRQPVDYIKSVSVLVGRGSGLPVQVRVEGNIGQDAYALIIFDYQNDSMPQNIREIMGYNVENERNVENGK